MAATISPYGILHRFLPQIQQWEDWIQALLGIKDRSLKGKIIKKNSAQKRG
jgi:hypothetical protein